jgi:hypothetical protein
MPESAAIGVRGWSMVRTMSDAIAEARVVEEIEPGEDMVMSGVGEVARVVKTGVMMLSSGFLVYLYG